MKGHIAVSKNPLITNFKLLTSQKGETLSKTLQKIFLFIFVISLLTINSEMAECRIDNSTIFTIFFMLELKLYCIVLQAFATKKLFDSYRHLSFPYWVIYKTKLPSVAFSRGFFLTCLALKLNVLRILSFPQIFQCLIRYLQPSFDILPWTW